ncbi:MAG: N-acetyltransferase [Alphaproteobacteria bacterium]|nr:N-acetyltransferase [Alphaproteobacteria bacterium]
MSDLPQFRDNGDLQRYEWAEDGLTTFAEYRRSGDRVLIPHVEAPPPLRGKGAADRLMRAISAHARQQRLMIIPLCGYAHAWFRRHSENADILE